MCQVTTDKCFNAVLFVIIIKSTFNTHQQGELNRKHPKSLRVIKKFCLCCVCLVCVAGWLDACVDVCVFCVSVLAQRPNCLGDSGKYYL